MSSACTENKYYSDHIANQTIDVPTKIEKVNLAEYIILLKKNVKIAVVINSLKKYDIQIIKDLKRGRYLIGLKYDPGIELLQKEIMSSQYIKHIQPNFNYKTQ